MTERTYLCQTCMVRFTYADARNHVCVGARDIHWAFQVSEEARIARLMEQGLLLPAIGGYMPAREALLRYTDKREPGPPG